MLTLQSTNPFSNIPAAVRLSGRLPEDSSLARYCASSIAEDPCREATAPVIHNAAGTNHATSSGFVDSGSNATVYIEPHSRGGSPTSPLQDSRCAPLSHVFAKEGGEVLLRIVELLYPVGRASLPTLVSLSGFPLAVVRASIYRLKDHGMVTVEERLDHRGRLLWARLTEQGRQDLAVFGKGDPDAGA